MNVERLAELRSNISSELDELTATVESAIETATDEIDDLFENVHKETAGMSTSLKVIRKYVENCMNEMNLDVVNRISRAEDETTDKVFGAEWAATEGKA